MVYESPARLLIEYFSKIIQDNLAFEGKKFRFRPETEMKITNIKKFQNWFHEKIASHFFSSLFSLSKSVTNVPEDLLTGAPFLGGLRGLKPPQKLGGRKLKIL